MLFNEPKLLKSSLKVAQRVRCVSFSALQRAEIAEIKQEAPTMAHITICFSALQRAEIAEIVELLAGLVVQFEFQCSSTSRNC